jgi:outer membrane protein assembly factor BamB
MKNKHIIIVVSFLLLGILLSSCTSASATNSWAGASASDTAVYFTNSTSIVAAQTDTGAAIWTYPDKPAATRLFYAAPVIDGDQLIVGDYSGLLVALGIHDGKELWQFTGAKGRYVDSPLVVNDKIIAPNADSHIYALDANGKLLWTFTGSHAFWATPVSDGTTVFAPSLDHFLYALNLADGTVKWKVDLGAPLVGRLVLSTDGTLYLGSLDSKLYAVRASDGSVLWKQSLSGRIWSAPVLVESSLYIGDDSGKINILNTKDGSTVQSIDLQSAILGSGVMLNGSIVFSDEKGEIIAIAKDGKRVWTRSITGKLYSNLVSNKTSLFVLPTKGDQPLSAFDADGNQIWNYTVSK